jgi:hypothetical protein
MCPSITIVCPGRKLGVAMPLERASRKAWLHFRKNFKIPTPKPFTRLAWL